MPVERRIRMFQLIALIAVVPTLVLMWMHMAFNSFADTHWYDPVVFAGLFINVIAQFAALRLVRRRAS